MKQTEILKQLINTFVFEKKNILKILSVLSPTCSKQNNILLFNNNTFDSLFHAD